MNDRASLALLLERGPMTRLQLSEATGLSGPTVSQVISRLSAAGLIVTAGASTGSRGPNAIVYRARIESFCGVAIHIRGGRIESCFVEIGGAPGPIAETRRLKDNPSAHTDVTAAIKAACVAADKDPLAVVAVCVGLPGAVSPTSDTLSFIGSLPGWPRKQVRSHLTHDLGLDVLIENDANLAATAEARVSGSEDFALLWQGEGVGVASVTAGRVNRGAAGGAGEIGYLPVSVAGTKLDPRAADLQDLAGAGAVTRLVKRHRASVRSYELALSALRSDEKREAMLADVAPRTAEALVPVIAVLDPAAVVLSGPTGGAGGDALARLVQTYLRDTTRWRTPVLATQTPDHAILTGARVTLIDHLTGLALSHVE